MKELIATRSSFADLAYKQNELKPNINPSPNLIALSPESMILDKRNSVLPTEPLLPLENVKTEKEDEPEIVIKVEEF